MRQVGCESKVSISIFCQLKAKKYDSNSATSSRITNLDLISAFFCKTVWLPTSTFIRKIPLQADSNLQDCQIQQSACIWCLETCTGASPVPTNRNLVIPKLKLQGTANLQVPVTSPSALCFTELRPEAPVCSTETTVQCGGGGRAPCSAPTAPQSWHHRTNSEGHRCWHHSPSLLMGDRPCLDVHNCVAVLGLGARGFNGSEEGTTPHTQPKKPSAEEAPGSGAEGGSVPRRITFPACVCDARQSFRTGQCSTPSLLPPHRHRSIYFVSQQRLNPSYLYSIPIDLKQPSFKPSRTLSPATSYEVNISKFAQTNDQNKSAFCIANHKSHIRGKTTVTAGVPAAGITASFCQAEPETIQHRGRMPCSFAGIQFWFANTSF